MTRALLAELVLSLVMPRQRASAAVGDLSESVRGEFSFWFSVARAALGAAFRQLTWGAFAKALVLGIALTTAFRFVFFETLTAGGRIWPQAAWTGPIFGVSYLLLSPGLVGWMVARSMPGREMAAWLATAAFVVLEVVSTAPTVNVPFTPVSLMLYLVGVVLARRRALRIV